MSACEPEDERELTWVDLQRIHHGEVVAGEWDGILGRGHGEFASPSPTEEFLRWRREEARLEDEKFERLNPRRAGWTRVSGGE